MSEQATPSRAQEARRKTRGQEIGWERWADGEEHLLRNGQDFVAGSVSSTRLAAQQWGRRQGLTVSCSLAGEGSDGGFWMQVSDGNPKNGGRPLTPEIIAAAKAIRDAEARGEDAAPMFRYAKRVIAGLPPIGDETAFPITKRRKRIAEQATASDASTQNALAEVVRSRKPGAGRRRKAAES